MPTYNFAPFTYDLAWSFSSTFENLWKTVKKKMFSVKIYQF